jgi:hypothetical protein
MYRRPQNGESLFREKIRHNGNPVAESRHSVHRPAEFETIPTGDFFYPAGKLNVQFGPLGSDINPAAGKRTHGANY